MISCTTLNCSCDNLSCAFISLVFVLLLNLLDFESHFVSAVIFYGVDQVRFCIFNVKSERSYCKTE